MKPTKEQLEVINSRLPGSKVTADMVEVLPFHVFDSDVTDRFTIMTMEMARKLVIDLNKGVAAFNRLHRSREELPAGRSVNGKLDTVGEGFVIKANMYAVVKNPDGTPMPLGKTLADGYNTGSVYACSAGVRTGFYKCSICGNDVRDYRKCEHIPGRQYVVDEVPKTCFAYMTGHNIVDGVAMDCGIYEVSAVTAGGVVNARSISETFGNYAEGVDPKEFKESLQDKEIETRLMFSAALSQSDESGGTSTPTEERTMDKAEVQEMMNAHYAPLKAEVERLKPIEAKYATLETEKKTADDALVALQGQFSTLETEKKELDEKFAALETEKATVEGERDQYRTALVTLATTKHTKARSEDSTDAFATLSTDDLLAKIEAYDAAILALPSGQQTGEETEGEGATVGSFDGLYATN